MTSCWWQNFPTYFLEFLNISRRGFCPVAHQWPCLSKRGRRIASAICRHRPATVWKSDNVETINKLAMTNVSETKSPQKPVKAVAGFYVHNFSVSQLLWWWRLSPLRCCFTFAVPQGEQLPIYLPWNVNSLVGRLSALAGIWTCDLMIRSDVKLRVDRIRRVSDWLVVLRRFNSKGH